MGNKRKPKTGMARQYELGRKVVTVPLTKEDHRTIKQAADKDGRSVTAFVRRAAMEAAVRMLEEGQKP